MSPLKYKNLSDCDSFKRLSELHSERGRVSLRAVLNAGRVRGYEIVIPLAEQDSLAAPSTSSKTANSETASTDPASPYLAYNYAAKQVNEDILHSLQALADEQELVAQYSALVAGEVMNTGEGRRVLHHLLRGQLGGAVVHKGQNIGEFYASQARRVAEFSEGVRSGSIASPSGRRFNTVVQIGIGGSDLGPRALYEALKNLPTDTSPKIRAHFISNVDPDDADSILAQINCETTLFVLVSKSGTTQETLANEGLVLAHLRGAGIASPKKHIVCVTSASSPLAQNSDYLDSFFIDDFIGGRYSSTSAVGALVLSTVFGADVFAQLLRGAALVDRASMHSDIRQNPALLDALIGVLDRNVYGYSATAILPYSQALHRFPAHLQQLDMESNGKQVNRRGEALGYHTGPLVFGEPGTNGQHSFYQLLHQGTDVIPLQFIGFRRSQRGADFHMDGSSSQQKLNANLAAQIIAFAIGKESPNDPNKNFAGERPSSLLYAEKLTPAVLGALLAHYENKVMFQGFAWNINSFAQEGVQLGKVLTKNVLSTSNLDPALLAFSQKPGLRK